LVAADGQRDRVEFRSKFVGVDIVPDAAVGHDLDAFGGHLLDAALNELLLELEVGYAVHQQSADAIRALIERDRMARAS